VAVSQKKAGGIAWGKNGVVNEVKPYEEKKRQTYAKKKKKKTPIQR